MKSRVKVEKTRPKNIGDGDNERSMVQPGMNPAVAARRRRAEEKRR